MSQICVYCAATFAPQDTTCSGCGLPRSASEPPSVVATAAAPAAVPSVEPDGTDGSGAVTFVPPPAFVPPTYVEPPAVQHDVTQHDLPQEAVAYTDVPEETARPRAGAVDACITLIGVALTFGLGWLVHGDLSSVQEWLTLRSADAFDLHDVLVVLVTFSPLALALLVAFVSRVPGSGLLAALAGYGALAITQEGPRILGRLPEIDLQHDWVVAIVLAAFLGGDLVLVLAGRRLFTGLLVGVVTGLAAAGYVAAYLLSLDGGEIPDEPWLLALYFGVPAAFLLLAGVVSGAVGGLRRR